MNVIRNLTVIIIAIVISGEASTACPSCYGAADGQVIDAANTAILAMLGITGTVVSSVAAFFVVLARRARRYAGDGPGGEENRVTGDR